jgi:PAS domain S-box-containing protein
MKAVIFWVHLIDKCSNSGSVAATKTSDYTKINATVAQLAQPSPSKTTAMLHLPGYKIFRKIYESDKSLVYRGVRSRDGIAAIFKVLKQDYPTPAELARYRQEYDILRSLNLQGVVTAYSLENYERTLAIVLEDFGGESLKRLMQERKFTLQEILSIAIQIAEILGEIHAANAIHKDINPANIVFNRNTKQLKIIDFGIAAVLKPQKIAPHPTTEFPEARKNANVLEGTLAYISPEQTGRMNRSLDYRTDFYSFGITLYEMFAKKLPFASTNPRELVHCHIAKQPIAPEKINPEIPLALSGIIMKLLAKNAEERYQSAWGIKADLEECLNQLQRCGTISEFKLGSRDIFDKFQIPEKLYGREKELATLLAAFERISQPAENENSTARKRSEMVLVAGDSGTGKSSLVKEMQKSITEKRGYFIAGKFDRLQQNIPYSALVKAFQGLIQQLLTESETKFQEWRSKLLAALDNNAQIIIDVIPEVESITGKQPAVEELGTTESQNRFNSVFQKFLRVFVSQEHPLVIFLDDLQWADSATLQLIQLMMARGINEEDSEICEVSEPRVANNSSPASSECLLVIGAYRNKEIGADRSLLSMVEELRKDGVRVDRITLLPLTIAQVTNLIADTLRSDNISVKPLAELVMRKTNGNPFFVSEFLKTLHAQNLISFNFPYCIKSADTSASCPNSEPECTDNWEGCQWGWQWDITEIEKVGITSNVVELMVSKLKQLPEATQEVLRLASCMGTDFDLPTLSIICQKSEQLISATLQAALESGLILPVPELNGKYKFLHDRVRQAAYALIESKDKKIFHLQIGCLLWDKCAPALLVDEIFKIVDWINIGITDKFILKTLIVEQEERDKIANLNLIAGKKAKASGAYDAAVKYLTVGRELLAGSSWQEQYELTLNIYVEMIESAYLNGEFELVEKLADAVIKQAKTLTDKLKVYEVKIKLLTVQRRDREAISIALQVLDRVGFSFPKAPKPSDILREMEQTAVNLAGKNIDDLMNLPAMNCPDRLVAMRIGASIVPAAFHAAPPLFSLLILSQVNSSIVGGNSPVSAFFYAVYGVLLNGAFQEFESAEKFGNLALNLASKFTAKNLKCRILYVIAAGILHGNHHVRKSLSMLREGYQTAREIGDLEIAGYCAKEKFQYSYFAGQELSKLELEIADSSRTLTQLKQSHNLLCNQICHQAVVNLLGEAKNPCELSGKVAEEASLLSLLAATNDRTGFHCFYLHKLILCYLFGSGQQALEVARKFRKYLTQVTGFFTVPVFYFYESLAALAAYPEADSLARIALLKRVGKNLQKIQEFAQHSPANHLHKYYLIEAEKHRVLGENFEAMEKYDRAISLAKENKYINEEALANELAAKLYLDWGKDKIARVYLADAHYCYTHWGARAKIEELEMRYPAFLIRVAATTSINSESTTITNISKSTHSEKTFDLAAVMLASQTIASEIVLDKLLAKLMKIAIQNAGAQKGFLVLENKGRWLVEASGTIDADRIAVLQSIPIEECLPVSLINYVARTKQSLVKTNAAKHGKFTSDPYIKKHQSKSILCAPLLNQGQLIGIIYLENNLISRAFTDDRVEVLQLLSTQAAVSITNAKLYAELQKSESKLTQFLEAVPVGITVHNPSGEVSYINQTGQRLLGQIPMHQATIEQLASTCPIYITGSEKPCAIEQLPAWRALQGENVTADNLEVRGNSKIVPLEMHSQPIFDDKNNIVYSITAFTDISDRKQAEKLLAEYNRTLEIQVADRTRELSQALQNLQATQQELIQSEKMAALGQLVAGVAHEINTPLGAIRSSVDNLAGFFNQKIYAMADFLQSLSPEAYSDLLMLLPQSQPQSIGISNREKRQFKRALARQLVKNSVPNSDTIADTLVDLGIYDKIESILPLLQNPDRAHILQKAYQLATLQKSTNTIITATDRAAKVVFALKKYSRYNCAGEKVSTSITEGIETILTLYYNQIKHGVEVIRNYQDSLPPVLCYSDELNQVWTNLIHNALQAMEYQGTLTIDVGQEGNSVSVSVTDSGKGIDPEIMPRIFDPFFTTKPAGEGSGLGLDIVRKIVEKHSGQIAVTSVPGKTTFVVSIPIAV